MVRRTKQDAQATRERILDTAERVFEARGVAGTTLNHIASAAGVTRGAIYWHFTDKADLFNAMMERITLPFEAVGGVGTGKGSPPSLGQLTDGLVELLRRVTTDTRAARVFDIVSHKVEYVGETQSLRARHVEGRNACVADIQRSLAAARRRGELPRGVPARAAAIGLHAMIDGLLRNWMLEPGGFDLPRVGRQAIGAYLGGLKGPVAGVRTTRPRART